MNSEQEEQWMEMNITMLIQRAANQGINPYTVYAYLNAGAQGVGSNLDEHKKSLIDEQLEQEFEGIYDN